MDWATPSRTNQREIVTDHTPLGESLDENARRAKVSADFDAMVRTWGTVTRSEHADHDAGQLVNYMPSTDQVRELRAFVLQNLAATAPSPERPEADELVPEWDVKRDNAGEPITVTWEQVYAIWHAVRVVELVRKAEGYESLWNKPQPNLYKSRLLGRMVIEGRPPTRTKPPNRYSEPRWDLLPGGDPFGDDGE